MSFADTRRVTRFRAFTRYVTPSAWSIVARAWRFVLPLGLLLSPSTAHAVGKQFVPSAEVHATANDFGTER